MSTIQKINFYKNNSVLRRKIAKKGKEKYFRYFDNKVVASFIIKKSLPYFENRIDPYKICEERINEIISKAI